MAPNLPICVCGRTAVASTHALEALGLWPEHAPDALYIGDVWLAAVESSSDAAAAAAILEPARRWIEAAAGRLPEEFRASFRDRNPANRELLARAGSRPAET